MRGELPRSHRDWFKDILTYKPYRTFSEYLFTLLGDQSIRPIVMLSNEQDLIYFQTTENGKIETPEPLIFDILAILKNDWSEDRVFSPIGVRLEALKIYKSLHETYNMIPATKGLRQNPYFEDCHITQRDVKSVLNWYFIQQGQSEILPPYTPFFDTIAEEKSRRSHRIVTPEEVQQKVREIFQALNLQDIRKYAVQATDFMNMDSYFQDCLVTEGDLVELTVDQMLRNDPKHQNNNFINDRFLVFENPNTIDETGNIIYYPRTQTALHTAIKQLSKEFQEGRGWMITDARQAASKSLEIFEKTRNENIKVVAREEKLPTTFSLEAVFDISIKLLGLVNQTTKMLANCITTQPRKTKRGRQEKKITGQNSAVEGLLRVG